MKTRHPLIEKMTDLEEVLWINPELRSFTAAIASSPLSLSDAEEAEKRLERFAPYIAAAFPETRESGGIIESSVKPISEMRKKLELSCKQPINGRLLLKCDNALPISGSIKARGGIYEVLKHTEDLALEHKMLKPDDDYSVFDSAAFRRFFSDYSIAVGSTGNLGLSIGIIGAALGFNVTVHMSADAKQWKKDLLRRKGAAVVEHASDYSKAVEKGREEAEKDPNCHFVDDKNSTDLFLGYATAAFRLKSQLEKMGIVPDENNPLFVYLPCGVGGGPAGIAFGLKLLFKDHVHCFFAEPTHSPAMLLGLMTNLHDKISVTDIGIDNITEADGLAVGRPSGFAGKIIQPFLSGSFTVSDDRLFALLKALADSEHIYLEPSALAGMIGPVKLHQDSSMYLDKLKLTEKADAATHLVWATGGGMVPEEIMRSYYRKGQNF